MKAEVRGQRAEDRGQKSESKPIVTVKYAGLQSGFGEIGSRALFNVVSADEPQLVGSTRTVESLEAEGYQVKEAA